ncbi:MAG: hypothetical protein KDK99_17985, partial [Verrucomicrobiales bacterium]|nr:hypothetical protein [Verrucomicrobiales bacterium]
TAFLEAGKNQDAAYVAERILTPDELRAYVDDHFTLAEAEKSADAPESVDPWDEMSSTLRWRWLLGRRLMRARRYQEALPYLPSTVRSKAQSYQQALEQAQDPSRPRVERARSWFEAAWRVRHHGFEMMATEVEPDAFCWSGSFEISSIATDRARGYWQPWSWKSEAPPKPQPLVTRVTSDERSRLEWSHLRHEKRFQYRYLAADHAWQASRLLPAQSEELADVLNTAGSWLKVRDPSAADRFYQALESRAGKTALGEQVTARHWFVEQTGPWSTALQHLQ